MEKEVTVVSIVQDIYELSIASNIKDSETGERISFEELQDLIYQDVEQLAETLGIELEE